MSDLSGPFRSERKLARKAKAAGKSELSPANKAQALAAGGSIVTSSHPVAQISLVLLSGLSEAQETSAEE